jgi:hypothetical protein
VASRGWIGITRDRRISRTAIEYDAVMFSGGRLLVLTAGSIPTDLLTRNFLNTLPKIEQFIDEHPAPFIATVYRPSPVEAILKGTPGSVKLRMIGTAGRNGAADGSQIPDCETRDILDGAG